MKRLTYQQARDVVRGVMQAVGTIDPNIVTVAPRDFRLFDAIPVKAATAYLASHGWELLEERSVSGLPAGLWQYGENRRCSMGHSKGFDDYGSSVADMLNRCAELESRSIWKVLADVYELPAAQAPAAEGSVPQ